MNSGNEKEISEIEVWGLRGNWRRIITKCDRKLVDEK